MNGNRLKWFVVLGVVIGVIIFIGAASSFATNEGQSPIVNGTLTSVNEVIYNYSFNKSSLSINVEIINPTDIKQQPSLAIDVDEWAHHDIDVNLTPGETYQDEIDLRDSIDVLNDTHTVTVSTFGNWTTHTFTTTEADLERNAVPKPHISDVEIVTDVFDAPYNTSMNGKTFTMAHITITNPTNQLYSMKLMVHSLETGGGWYPASVSRGENRTIKAVLDEDLGATVAGEARLYTGKPSEMNGSLDQVEFVGRAGEETDFYTRPYQPVTPPWEANSYEYENESVARAGGVLGTSVESLVAIQMGAFVAGLLLLVLVVFRRR